MAAAWTLLSWEQTLWQSPWPDPPLRHLETSVTPGEVRPGCKQGMTLWACETPRGPAGLGWEWIEVRPRVLALADPMHMISNLRLVDDEGVPIPESKRVLVLNSLVHALPWQAIVRRAIRDAQATPTQRGASVVLAAALA